VAEPNADLNLIEQTIKTMPHYFSDYDTFVHFIEEEEFKAQHVEMPHGGFVFRAGATGESQKHRQRMEFSLQLESNPEFTAHVMLAYARAAHHLYLKGETGARTVLDIPIGMLVAESLEILRKEVL
jgi:diaminopimelate dehydrogenase